MLHFKVESADYVDFLTVTNGGEGFVGDDYLILWKVEELATFNREYEVAEYAPGILLFGSSGGGEGYGFDYASDNAPVVRIPFVGMDRDYANPMAPNFSSFLSHMPQNTEA